MTATLREVVAAAEALWPPALAESWDAIGLVAGDPDDAVDSVLLAVDPVEAVAGEALDGGHQLLLTHHPLYLRGTTSVAADDPKGRVVHGLVRGGCGLLVAHTNADKAHPGGVSDALADLFALRDVVPLVPEPRRVDKLVVFVPTTHAEAVRHALAAAGAGRLGDYDSCAFASPGTGTFRPLPGAEPFVGSVGELARVEEVRLEVLVPPAVLPRALAALRASHPYDVPAFDVVPLHPLPGDEGLGRVGELAEPVRFGDLVARAADLLPRTTSGVRGKGDPDRLVSRLAVLGGAGDSELGHAAAAGAQAFLTADLRHHPTSEAPEELCLLDAAHWATEWPWLATAARLLEGLVDVRTTVSTQRTDPWTVREDGGVILT